MHRHRTRAAVVWLAIVLTASTAATPASAQPERERKAPPSAQAEAVPAKRVPASKPKHSKLEPGRDRRHVVLKFAEGTDVRLRGNRFASPSGAHDVKDVNDAVARFGARPERGFGQGEQKLDGMRRDAEARSGVKQADLNLYFHLFLPEGADTVGFLDALNASSVVEIAYAQQETVETQFRPCQGCTYDGPQENAPPDYVATPDFRADQDYADAATTGIGVAYARQFAGGTGSGVRIVDVERGWRFNHEDLGLPSSTLISGVNRPGSMEHGTAVLGELVARNDSKGVTGLVYGASVRAASACRTATSSNPCATTSVAQAITDALDHLLSDGVRAGVILIEQQTSPGLLPVEVNQQEFDAILLATSRGITVVEAAGNGGMDLDQVQDANGRFVLRPSTRHSGAVMVGAGFPPDCAGTCADRNAIVRANWGSNFGARVNLQGWGENVVTLGYGDLFAEGATRRYTDTFGGTSSASPIVTAAVASLQGISVARTGFPMHAFYIENILRRTGSKQPAANAEARHIGPRPDLRAAINTYYGDVSYAYQITKPAWGSSHDTSMTIAVRLHVYYTGIVDRFEVGAYYSDSPGSTSPYWHQPVVTLDFRPAWWGQPGNCIGWFDCELEATWRVSRIRPQEVRLHGWAINDKEGYGANKHPQVRVKVV